MTKKEKKDLALKLKAEIDAKHAHEKPATLPDKVQMKKYNERRYRNIRRQDKDDEMYRQLRRRYRD